MEELFVLYIIHDIPEDELLCLFEAAVLKNGSDRRLQCVRYHRIPLSSPCGVLALSQEQIIRKSDTSGVIGQRRLTDETCAKSGEFALRHLRIGIIEILAGYKFQHSVPEKLQSLIAAPVSQVLFVGV